MNRVRPLQTFLGAPFAEDLDRIDADIAFLGVPFGHPYDMRGVRSPAADGPDAVRRMLCDIEYPEMYDHWDFDLDRPLVPRGLRIVDCGDVAGDPHDLAAAPAAESAAVRSICRAGAVPLIVGGDDAIPPIVSAGLSDLGPLHVLHVDSHLDFRDEVGGVREGFSSPIRRLRDQEWIGSIVQVGLRGAGSARRAEVEAARAAGNTLITARELHAAGPESVLAALPSEGPVFVTIDCDGLDPSIAPGVGYPELGGVTYAQVTTLVRSLALAGRIAAIECTEYRPALDVRQLTALTIGRILMSVVTLGTPRQGAPTEGVDR